MLKGMKKALFLVLILLLPVMVSAKVAEAGDKVKLEGEYDSTKIVAGNEVENDASIDGVAMLFGNNVKSNGEVDYGALAGNSLTVDGKVNHDLFVAGNFIVLDEHAEIARDAFIAGNDLRVKTNIGRNLYYAGTFIDLSGITVNGNAIIYAEEIKMDKDTVITGKLTYSDESNVTGLDEASIGETKVVETKNLEKDAKRAIIVSEIKDWIFSIATAFITLLAIFYMFPKIKEKLYSEKIEAGVIVKTSFIGLAVLIVLPIVALMALLTNVLIPLSLLALAVYGFSIYFAVLFVYAIVGRKLYALTGKESNMYLELIIGILVVKLVKLIPVVGGIVSAICLFYGLGLILNYIRELIKKAD